MKTAELDFRKPTPISAVADAMMHIQYQFMKDLAYPDPDPSLDVYSTLEARSSKLCRFGSANVVAYLSSKHSDLFEYLVLLRSRGKEGTFNQGTSWRYHEFFLTKAHDGTWLAGSPANYREDQDQSPLTTVFSSKDLAEVMKNIGDAGGTWPDNEFIPKELKSVYKKPRIYREDERKILQTTVIEWDEQPWTGVDHINLDFSAWKSPIVKEKNPEADQLAVA